MRGPDLPDDVLRLIQSSVPAIDALEVLVLLCRGARSFTAKEIASGFPSINSPEPILAEYLRLLKSQGIVTESEGGSFAYHPAAADIEEAVMHLLSAYDERPVTLIRTIYAIADSRNIKTFADAFRLRKET